MNSGPLAKTLSRSQFLARFGATFDALFAEDSEGTVVFRHEQWRQATFAFDLWTFLSDPSSYRSLQAFAFPDSPGRELIFAEVESVERFTSACIVEATPEIVRTFVGNTELPHFRTACFTKQADWAAIFDNMLETTVVACKPAVT
jgi:hypothetical protein